MISGGEDTAVLGLKVQFGRAELVALCSKLQAAKDQAQVGGDASLMLCDQKTENQFRFVVAASGAKGGGPYGYLRFMARCGGVNLKISDKWFEDVSLVDMPNVYVEIGSLLLMEVGSLEGVWGDIESIVRALGGRIVKALVSRVDVCFDLPEVPLSYWMDLYREDKYACLARAEVEFKQNTFAKGVCDTGFVLGCGTQLRVYNKTEEAKSSPAKVAALVAYRWGGHRSSDASRVEFQLRRDALRRLRVDTVADWFEGRAEVVEWLVNKWFRFTADSRHGDNIARSATDPAWLAIQNAVSLIYGYRGEPRGEVERRRMDCRTQRRKAFGQLMTCIANEDGGFVMDESDVFVSVQEQVRKWLQDVGFGGAKAMLLKRCEKIAALNKSCGVPSIPADCGF